MKRSVLSRITIALAPLVLAALGPLVGHAWLGHGLYKLALVGLPFLCGRRFVRPAAPSFRALLESAAVGAALGGVAYLLCATLLPSLVDLTALRKAFDARYGYTPATAILASLLIIAVNSLIEEWFYRGLLDDLVPSPLASLVFSLQHVIVLGGLAGWAPAALAGVAVYPAGLAWTWIYRRHGLGAAWLSHALADLALLGGGLYLLGYLS